MPGVQVIACLFLVFISRPKGSNALTRPSIARCKKTGSLDAAVIWYHAHTGLLKPQKTGHVGIPGIVLMLFFVKQDAAIWTRNLYQVH